jgi:hypothetical protein
MRFIKIALPLILCLVLAFSAYSQRSSSGSQKTYTKSRTVNKHNPIRMSHSKRKVVCPIFEDSGFPYHGIGIKVGDPFALTYKYYASKHFAVAADFGRSASGLYSQYYAELFHEFQPETSDYYSHKVEGDWVGEVKLMYQMGIEKVSPGLQFYVGLGWEIRNLKIRYDYFADEGGLSKNFQDEYERLTQGVQGVVGIEYSYFKLPISAFMELEYYCDVVEDPGYTKIQGGAGLRYVF